MAKKGRHKGGGRGRSRAPDRGRQQVQEIILSRQAFWLPRQGYSLASYQDAFRLPPGDALPYRVALAASRGASAFARTWAQLLAGGFVTDPTVDAETFYECVAAWQGVWHIAVTTRTTDGKPVEGAPGTEASFLGLVIHAEARWEALSVGTCCLFHLRQGDLLSGWPTEALERPRGPEPLVPSVAGKAEPPLLRQTGQWASGDVFLLATGALASWLWHTGAERAYRYTQASFEADVAEARAQNILRDEDVTLIIVEVR